MARMGVDPRVLDIGFLGGGDEHLAQGEWRAELLASVALRARRWTGH